jgi:hypothetical protein
MAVEEPDLLEDSAFEEVTTQRVLIFVLFQVLHLGIVE